MGKHMVDTWKHLHIPSTMDGCSQVPGLYFQDIPVPQSTAVGSLVPVGCFLKDVGPLDEMSSRIPWWKATAVQTTTFGATFLRWPRVRCQMVERWSLESWPLGRDQLVCHGSATLMIADLTVMFRC